MGFIRHPYAARFLAAFFILTATSLRADAADTVDSLVTGADDAPVTIIELVDYQCIYCKQIHPAMVNWAKNDPRIRLDVREVALLSPTSIIAAKAALAASPQGKRSEMHESLMSYRGTLSKKIVFDIAKVIGIDPVALQAHMDANDVQFDEILFTNLKLGLAHRITGTPAFLVNGRYFQGADLEQLHRIVDEEYQKTLSKTPG